MRERLELLGTASARILEPIQAYGVTPEQIEQRTLAPFWSEGCSDLVRVHHATDEVVDVGETGPLGLFRARVSAVPHRHGDDVPDPGVPGQPFNTPVGAAAHRNQYPHPFGPEQGFETSLVEGAVAHLGHHVIGGGRLEFVYDLRSRRAGGAHPR